MIRAISWRPTPWPRAHALFSPAAADLGLTAGKFNLLATFTAAFWSIIVMVVWKVAGFTMVIITTGLQEIPTDLHDATKLDGACAVARFWSITLPLIRHTRALALILSVTGSVLAFDQVYIILRGGPRSRTLTAVSWTFNQFFVSPGTTATPATCWCGCATAREQADTMTDRATVRLACATGGGTRI